MIIIVRTLYHKNSIFLFFYRLSLNSFLIYFSFYMIIYKLLHMNLLLYQLIVSNFTAGGARTFATTINIRNHFLIRKNLTSGLCSIQFLLSVSKSLVSWNSRRVDISLYFNHAYPKAVSNLSDSSSNDVNGKNFVSRS